MTTEQTQPMEWPHQGHSKYTYFKYWMSTEAIQVKTTYQDLEEMRIIVFVLLWEIYIPFTCVCIEQCMTNTRFSLHICWIAEHLLKPRLANQRTDWSRGYTSKHNLIDIIRSYRDWIHFFLLLLIAKNGTLIV